MTHLKRHMMKDLKDMASNLIFIPLEYKNMNWSYWSVAQAFIIIKY